MSTYVPNKTYAMTVNDTGNMVFISASGNGGTFGTDRDRVYVTNTYRNNGQQVERAQSSWSYWISRAAQVLQILCINEVVSPVQYGTEVFLERMSVTDRLGTDNGAPYPLLLDAD